MRTRRRPTHPVCLLLAVLGSSAAFAAPPPAIDLTQTTSQSITPSGSINCASGAANAENSYYRAFDLPALLSNLAPLRVTSVEFGVESANDGAGGGQLVDVRLYTTTALPPLVAGLTLIASQNVLVADQSLTTVTVPIDVVVPLGVSLVVEIYTPNGSGTGDLFYLGSNDSGQSAPSYIRAPSCGISEITALSTIAFPNTMWVMTVHGQIDLPAAPPACTADYFRADNTTPVPLADPGVITSTISIFGHPTYLLDVNVRTNLAHTFSADLDVTLTSPLGTVVTLTTDNGGAHDDCFDGTVWNDDANPGGQVPYTTNPGLVTDHGSYTGGVVVPHLVPEEGLIAFLGEDPNGTWTLSVSDDLALEPGTLHEWGLELTTLTATPTRTVDQRQNVTPVVIPTGTSVVTSTIEVAGLPPYVSLVGLDTSIQHPFPGDLDVTLQSPAGTVVTITTDNGVGNENVFANTAWSALANPAGVVPYATNDGMVTDHLYVASVVATPLTPEESFGAFAGEDPNGTWTLTISDDMAPDGGSLDAWTLRFDALTCETTTTTSSTSTSTTSSSSTSISTTSTTSTTVSTTSTTAPAGGTTTTTLPPTGGCVAAATIESVRCRLAAMSARVTADVPAPTSRKLGALLRKADASVARAGTVGASSANGRRAVRKAVRLLRKLERKLGAAAVPDDVRTELRDTIATLVTDLPAVP